MSYVLYQEMRNVEFDKSVDKRKIMIENLKKEIRKHASLRSLAISVGKSYSWIYLIFNGNYPSYKCYFLPKNIWRHLEAHGFTIPNEIKTFSDMNSLREQGTPNE